MTYKHFPIRLRSMRCLLGQCFQACVEVFGSSFDAAPSPLRLRSFPLPLLSPSLPFRKEPHCGRVSIDFIKSIALSFFTSGGHHRGAAGVFVRTAGGVCVTSGLGVRVCSFLRSLLLSGQAYLLRRWCCVAFGYECFSLSLTYSLWQCNTKVWIMSCFHL